MNRQPRNLLRSSGLLGLVLLGCLLLPSLAAASQDYTQDFTLQPGWNAIYLEVDPPDRDPEVVFQGLPIRSVWTWRSRQTSLEFVADASERRLRSSGWLGFFPPNRLEAYLSNLVEIQVNRAYLVKLGGTAPVSFSVTGRPRVRKTRWQPDSFNLVGFGVTDTPPTFQNFFAGSSSHAGQPIYRLDAGGTWRLASPSESMSAGEAFWVYSDGASDYDGPIDFELSVGDSLDFGAGIEELDLFFTNRSPGQLPIRIRRLPGESGGVDVLQVEDPSVLVKNWQTLPGETTFNTQPGETVLLKLGPSRGDVAGAAYEAMLEITDGKCRRLLPVHVDPVTAAPTRAANRAPSHPNAGLWLGSVVIDQVNEVHATLSDGSPGDDETPTPTPAQFEARLLIHVDDQGNARLLKDVMQMWQDGTTTTDQQTGLQSTATPGQFVLVTDKTKLSNYSGAALRGNELAGRRISSSFVDFAGNELPASNGNFGTSLSFVIELAANHPTNPFRHRFHPEHDGTPPPSEPAKVEVYPVTRTMTLTFASDDPEPGDSPDWGVTRFAGTFNEQLEGLHKRSIFVDGSFTLRRFSTDGVLNP